MASGLPKAYIKKWGVTKLAWRKFRAKALSKSRGKNPSRRKTKKVKRKLARRYRRNPRRRRKRQMTIPLAPVAGLAVGLAQPIQQAMAGDIPGALKTIARTYTGIDPDSGRFYPTLLMRGLAPLIGGILVHKFVGGPPLNVNRTLAAAGVPFIRI